MLTSWNRHAAAAHVRRHAAGAPAGRCAQAVREAIEAGGVVLDRVASAKDWGPNLERLGFALQPLHGERFWIGDIAVLPAVAGHAHGHVALFDGEAWVSDFVQNDVWAGSAWRQLRPALRLYRLEPPPTPEQRRMFAGALRPVVLPAGTQLFKFTGDPLPERPSPWWALRHAAPELGAEGFVALLRDAERSDRPVAEFVRDRFAVALAWSPLGNVQNGLLRAVFVRLLRSTFAWHGRCAPVLEARAVHDDPRPDHRFGGGAHQLLLPDPTPGDRVLERMQLFG